MNNNNSTMLYESYPNENGITEIQYLFEFVKEIEPNKEEGEENELSITAFWEHLRN